MKTILPHLVLLSFALGCAAPPASALQESESLPSRATSIRFGDPEDLGYDAPFFPGATYAADVPAPDEILGQRLGTRLSHHDEIVAAFARWAEVSPRLMLGEYGRTHEGRRLVYAVITSPANHAHLDEIRARHARLDDPRGLEETDAAAWIERLPAIAWLGYSIHGDELSGADAAMALGYHLVACTDEEVVRLLDQVVVVIDPDMNPDGRERIISMVEQSAGYTPNLDYASMHRGRWPYGRGNHYLFDMNRDWMAGTQPETRGRWQVLRRFPPQLFVDAHEMGADETFLFYPQNAPINPHYPEKLLDWQKRFAQDAAAAFDQHGWSYYTREWAEGWAPIYSDAWGSLSGATGILYEQANTLGSPLRRPSGRVLTYRETVHHQLTASWANLRTLAANRVEVLADYLATKRRNVAADAPGNDRMFVFRPGGNASRTRALLRMLLEQGIEVRRTARDFEVTNARHVLGAEAATLLLPAGSYAVPARQPRGAMVRAYLELDPRMSREDLQEEREELERRDESLVYDITSWCLAHALAIDGWWCDAAPAPGELVTETPVPATTMAPLSAGAPVPVAWAVDGTDDASVAFAARAMEAGLRVHLAGEPFRVGEATLPRGSLLVRRNENDGSAEEIAGRVRRAAEEAGVADVRPAGTALAPGDEADLGGQHFVLLARPRVAVLANAPISPDAYGHLWHHLDAVLGVPFTILDAQAFVGADLRRYNVLIVPPGWGGIERVLEPQRAALETWVRDGGTLIATGGAAAALTRERLGLSDVVLRDAVLDDLAPYLAAARREREARAVEIVEAEIWGDSPPPVAGEAAAAPAEESAEPASPPKIDEEEESWARRFAPHGATLRGIVDEEAWITVGAGAELPVPYSGGDVFLSGPGVETAVRLAEAERLRLGGLVWPEARARLAEGAWLTVERAGHGQVILFAATPAFRGYHLATGRLFANAVVYGPGAGADQPSEW
ncbi:MAG: M14 family zinc carboxypeptidase [Planctomycetota bacterium]